MSAFTNYLKRESEVIRFGLELLKSYCLDLEQAKTIPPEDLRIAVFAMQILVENSHLPKEENLLYPILLLPKNWDQLLKEDQQNLRKLFLDHQVLRKNMLELRKSIDEYEIKRNSLNYLFWNLNEFIHQIADYLEKENKTLFTLTNKLLDSSEQQSLLYQADKFDAEKGIGDVAGPRNIFKRLRIEKGLDVA